MYKLYTYSGGLLSYKGTSPMLRDAYRLGEDLIRKTPKGDSGSKNGYLIMECNDLGDGMQYTMSNNINPEFDTRTAITLAIYAYHNGGGYGGDPVAMDEIQTTRFQLMDFE